MEMSTDQPPTKPKVGTGVGVVVRRRGSDSYLVGIRLNTSHGQKTLALPGGWLEQNESFEQCALRECEEEIGLKAEQVVSASLNTQVFPCLNKKFNSTSFFVDVETSVDFEPRNLEPNKCAGWTWRRGDENEECELFPSLAYFERRNLL